MSQGLSALGHQPKAQCRAEIAFRCILLIWRRRWGRRSKRAARQTKSGQKILWINRGRPNGLESIRPRVGSVGWLGRAGYLTPWQRLTRGVQVPVSRPTKSFRLPVAGVNTHHGIAVFQRIASSEHDGAIIVAFDDHGVFRGGLGGACDKRERQEQHGRKHHGAFPCFAQRGRINLSRAICQVHSSVLVLAPAIGRPLSRRRRAVPAH